MNISEKTVVIVGAGIAGLTAAYYLKQRGIAATVLESANRVGGRMISDRIEGHVVDCGAQFLSSEYFLILKMLQELNLQNICETSQCSAIVRDALPRRMRIHHPFDVFGLFKWRSVAKLMRHMLFQSMKQKTRSLSDYSQWAKFDTELTSTWSNRVLDNEMTEYFYEPMLQGFYFQTPEETSKALAFVLSSFSWRQAKTLTLRSGLGTLPEILAKNLDVNLNTSVHSIETFGSQLLVHTDFETLKAEHVIVTTPAPIAQKLISVSVDEVMQSLLATPYRASINVACLTNAAFTLPANLSDVYGMLIPRKERTTVAAVGIENNKYRICGVDGHLLSMMWSHDAATSYMSASDAVIGKCAVQSISHYFPTLTDQVKQLNVYRWPMAEPLSPVGRSGALEAYRLGCVAHPPALFLAGDYMSMPFTEGAAESGYWAANRVIQAIGK